MRFGSLLKEGKKHLSYTYHVPGDTVYDILPVRILLSYFIGVKGQSVSHHQGHRGIGRGRLAFESGAVFLTIAPPLGL